MPSGWLQASGSAGAGAGAGSGAGSSPPKRAARDAFFARNASRASLAAASFAAAAASSSGVGGAGGASTGSPKRAARFAAWLGQRPEKRVAVAAHSGFLLALFNAVLDLPDDARGWFGTGECRAVALTFAT